MLQPQVHRYSSGAVSGEVAILGLLSLIYNAVRACDDDLVSKLDRILRDVEALIVDVNGVPRESTSAAR